MIKVIERNQTVERDYCDVCGERQYYQRNDIPKS